MVPGAGKPQALNRYGYVFNNPLKYTDPSGHDPLDSYWEQEFRKNHDGRAPTDQDRQDRLFSLLFAGSGDEGTWTNDDWARFSQNRDHFYGSPSSWNGVDVSGLKGFAKLTDRLSHLYLPNETNKFAKAFGLLFGGVAYNSLPVIAAFGSLGGPQRPLMLQLGTTGWNPSLWDDQNPSHHYAGLFYAGFFFGRAISNRVGDFREEWDPQSNFPWIRRLDPRNEPDIRLGHIAVVHGDRLGDYYFNFPNSLKVNHYDLSTWIYEALR
jgi:hypothetical protein